MSTFDYYLIGVMLVLLLANTVFQFKLGFSQGSKGGYTVGIYHAIAWFMKNRSFDFKSEAGTAMTPGDVVAFIIKSNTYEKFRLTEKSEIKKIAEATLEIDKD
jgi:hypothetical protein